MVVSAVAVPQAGLAQTCQRTVSIAPQVSGGEGIGRLTVAVYSAGCAAAGEVGYQALAGTALPSDDFLLPSGRLRWAAGDSAAVSISVEIRQDSVLEADLEDFTVRLINPGPGVIIVRPIAQGRILDDDRPNPRGSVDDSFCGDPVPSQWCGCTAELSGQGCECTAEIMPWRPFCGGNEFNLSAPQSSPLILHWSTFDGTARAGIDYAAVVDQALTVPAGQTAARLLVPLLSRLPGSPCSWFYVRVTAMSAGALVDAVAMVTIDGT